jgi:hypothetical protein
VLDPESNVQFGEGGAGTFSDGKLWSQVKDRTHYGRKVLEEFVLAGAPEEILFVSKPHIGTFRLVSMVEKMRATIEGLGGEIRFGCRVEDIAIDDGRVTALRLASGETLACRHVVLAIGHSARDTFEMLHARGVHVEAKPFSIGFRIEHPQSLIDRARFGDHAGHPLLGAADYRLVHHCRNGRAVYSFCMCPGGTVVAATSETGRVVTNGMSQYSRNERNANAGLVVGITPEDYPGTSTRRNRVPALVGGARVRARRRRLLGAGAARRRFPRRKAVARMGLGDSIVYAGRQAVRPRRRRAGLRDRRAARGAARTGSATARIRAARRGADRGRDAHVLADPDPARRGSSKHQHARPVSRRRGCGYAGGIYSAAIDGIEVAQAVALDMLERSGSTCSNASRRRKVTLTRFATL